MFKFAANISTMFKEYSFLERLEAARNSDFKFYEIQSPYEYDAVELQRRATGLKCVLVNSYFDSNYPGGYGAVIGHQDVFCTSLNKVGPYYFNLGVQKLHVLAGMRDERFRLEDQVTCFVDNLKSSSEFLENFAMTALIEPMCEEVKPGYFLNSFDMAVDIITSTGMNNVKLLLDIYHLHKITGDVEGNLDKFYPFAGHIQISQAPGRCEPFIDGGEIDYEYVFNYLEKKNHTDPIGLEYSPSAGKTTQDTLSWMQRFSSS